MKTINVTMLSLLAPVLAFAQYDQVNQFTGGGPGMQAVQPNPGAFQSGAAVDSGAGLLVIGILIYFLFFKKKGGAK
jgi:hypothetical protein